MSAKEEANEDVELETPKAASTSEAVTNGLVSEAQAPFIGVFASASVLLIALTSENRETLKLSKYWEYGVSIAVISMFFALVGSVFCRMEGLKKHNVYNSYFLILWNFIGACIMTFGGPFKSTGNGYFASWGMSVFSILTLEDTAKHAVTAVKGYESLVGMFLSSFVVLLAVTIDGVSDTHRSEAFFALVVACFTIVVCVGLKLMTASIRDGKVTFAILAVFAAMWIVAACLVTFRGPFVFTGNGYFGSWGGAIAATFAAIDAGN